MKIKEQIGSVEQRLPNEIPGRLSFNPQVRVICHSGSREAGKENNPPIHRWEPPFLDSNSQQGRQSSNKKLPNEPICHFSEVTVNEPFAKNPRRPTHENEPIFPAFFRPNVGSMHHRRDSDSSRQLQLNPTNADLKKNVFFKSALRCRVRIEMPRPILRQNRTGQTALVLRWYAPVLRGIRALKMLSRKKIDVYWNLYSDCYPV